jgi:thiol-disulfide isomerase/thioredoxin
MKFILPTILIATLAFVSGAAETDADTLWKKVDDAVSAMKKRPETPPKSREEDMERFKKLIVAADEAGREFTTKFPADGRRWKIRLFEAMTANVREALGIPGKTAMTAALSEIVKAADADMETKGEAGGVLVLVAAEEMEQGGGDPVAWLKQAGEHLAAFPAGRFASVIKGKIDSTKTLADLKTKPLEIKFTAVDGKEVDLANLRGKVVLIDFWATWCGPCVGEVPNVVKSYEKLHPKGFEIVGISLDSDKAALESFVKDKKMTWPQYFDGKQWKNEIATKYGVNSIPAMWLVDKKGMVVSTNARGKLEELVEKYLAE